MVAAAGEHYVLYRLHREGFTAALAPRNLRDVDVIVFDSDKGVGAALQVKTRTQGSDGGWHMKDKHERIVQEHLLYVFVDLEPPTPTTYVLKSALVAVVLADYHRLWLATPGKKGPHKDTEMRRLLPRYPLPFPACPEGWLDAHRDNWAAVKSLVRARRDAI